MDPTSFHRRGLIGFGVAASLAPSLAAAQGGHDGEIVRLWPGRPPGPPATVPPEKLVDRGTPGAPNRGVSGVANPHMHLVRPERPNGSALLIVPGGGYGSEWFDKEGLDVAHRLKAAGVTSFVLRYRLPAEGWSNRSETPLQDAQRAMRLIRARAAQWRVDPNRVGVMGFSAGGHLGGTLSTRDRLAYPPLDAADQGPARPNLSALIYPVIDMAAPHAHAGSARALLGDAPTPQQIEAYSLHRQVNADTPPSFLVHAMDDGTVPVENSLAYLAALRAAKVPAEAHIFEEGGHGFAGPQSAGKLAGAWLDLFVAWAGRRGFFKPG